MMIRIRNVVLALLLVTGVAACGSSSSGTSGGGSGSSGPTATSGNAITMQNFSFKPATLTVKVGTKVTFTNDDSAPHHPTGQGNSTISSPVLAKGQTYTVTFTKAGTYSYYCSIHPYMKGTIIVQ